LSTSRQARALDPMLGSGARSMTGFDRSLALTKQQKSAK
jgi:hypothetical protein